MLHTITTCQLLEPHVPKPELDSRPASPHSFQSMHESQLLLSHCMLHTAHVDAPRDERVPAVASQHSNYLCCLLMQQATLRNEARQHGGGGGGMGGEGGGGDLGGEGCTVEHGLVGQLPHEPQLWQVVQLSKGPHRHGHMRRPVEPDTK